MEAGDMWTWRSADSLFKPGTAAKADEWMEKGRLCEQQHRLRSAIDAYEHAARSPDRGTASSANYCLGRLYEERRRFSSAIRAYRRATMSADHDMAASANYHLGRLYEHRHRRALAIGAYERAVRLGGADAARAREAVARLRPLSRAANQ
jgi:tetratricopeptide (TPR) repeat protein